MSAGVERKTEQVKVFCRIRPADDSEETCISVLDDCTLVAQSKHGSSGKQSFYAFSRVFAPDASQEFVFSETLLPCVERVLNGENALLFTYGVTSSGKTYTMQGDLENPGLLPRSLDIIFNSISSYSTMKYVVKPTGQNGFVLQSEAEAIMDRQRLDYTCNPKTPSRPENNTPSFETRVRQTESIPLSKKSLYAVFVSFIELYNNNIYDLLAPLPSLGSLPRPHNLREDGNRNIYVPGIMEAEVKTADEALKHFYQGSKRRRVASTALNDASSRSHSIFTIRIVRAGYDPNYDEVIQDNSLLTVSQLCLVDLAGSERTSRSGTTGHRLKEASQINNSLMNLRRCIDVLRTNQMASPREDGLGLGVSQTIPRKVPYRDTKLTHLFKSYFEGGGQVLVLICIRPKVEEYDETLHVLEFAEHSQSVTTTTTVPSTPRATPVSSRGSSPTLEAANDELLAAIERCQALDKDLQVCVSKILNAGRKLSSPSLSASESFFDMPLICCPAFFDESDPDRDKSSDPESAAHPLASWRRSSNAQKTHHLTNNCPLFEVLRARAAERSRARELLERVSQDVQSSLMNMVRPADARNAQLTLLDSLNSMTIEKQRMESKIRHLENEVAKNRLLARHEKSERLREADNARAQLQRLRNHVQDMTPNCRTPHTRVPASGRKRASKMDTDAEEDLARDKRSRNENSPPTVGRVAALSRRYESRLQEDTGSAKRGAQTAVPSTAPVRRLRDANSRRHTPTSPLADILNRPAPVNPRHRRSKSAGGGKAVWLEHKEIFAAPLGTILAPSIKARKSATQVELKDTLVATDYLLHHQTTDPEGNVETRLFKGSILPTAGGGSAVIFNDVEELRQKSPLRTSLRRSRRQSRTSQPPEDSGAEEGDVAPTPAKRHTSTRGRRSKHSSLGSQSSAAVRTIDSASDLPEEEDVTSQASSYYPVNPPTKDSPPSAFPTCLGIGISSGGGIGHSAGCRK